MCIETMKGLFEKTPVHILKQLILRGKVNSYYILLEGYWYMKKMNEKLPPLKNETRQKNHKKGG